MERLSAQHLIDVLPPYDTLRQKIDERICLRVDVVPVEDDLGIIQYLSQSPYQWLGIPRQGLIGPQAVQVHTVRLEGSVVAHVVEGLRSEAQPRVLP
jgi:hypothetical protein